MAYRLGDLAERVGGRVRGDGERQIASVTTLDAAGPDDLSFLTSPRYRKQAEESRAAALLVKAGVDLPGKDLLVVEDPSLALAHLVPLFYPPERREPGVDPKAVVEPGARVAATAFVGPYAVIGAGSVVGEGVEVHPGVVVGRNCAVGAGSVLHPHAVLYDGTELGEGVVVHAGTVLGSDGFGYASHGGTHHKVPQVGRVVVGSGVEIGANSAVDRATFGATRVGAGTKIDNLVQVGHNVELGEGCILCGQAGIAGSARLGDHVVLGGQAGAAGHLEIGDGVQVAAKSAVLQSVAEGEVVAGVPAVAIRQWRRQLTALRRIERLGRRVDELERALAAREEPEEGG